MDGCLISRVKRWAGQNVNEQVLCEAVYMSGHQKGVVVGTGVLCRLDGSARQALERHLMDVGKGNVEGVSLRIDLVSLMGHDPFPENLQGHHRSACKPEGCRWQMAPASQSPSLHRLEPKHRMPVPSAVGWPALL